MNPTTTLAEIRKHHPCADGWKTALRNLGPDMDAPITLGDIALSNGALDALWCVHVLDWQDIPIRRAVVGGVVLPAVRRAYGYAQTAEPEFVRAFARWADGDDAVNLADVESAARAAAWAAADAAAARATERAAQLTDIVRAFPPLRMKERTTT